jgi:hypothetical protein
MAVNDSDEFELSDEEIEFFSSVNINEADEDTLEALEKMAEFYGIEIGDPDPNTEFPEIDYSIFEEEEPEEEWGDFEIDDYLDSIFDLENLEDLEDIEIITSEKK